MKYILTSALALSLLSGTAAMAQPDTQLRMSQNNYGDQQDNSRQDRRERRAADQKASDEATADQKAADQKAADKAAADLKAAQRKAADKAATTRRTNIDTAGDKQINNQRATDQKNRDTRAAQERVRDKQVDDRRTNDQREMDQRRIEQRSGDRSRSDARRWSRGDRLPDQYRQDRYYVNDWRQYGLNRPPRGYRWVRDDNNNFFLAAIATGIISMVIYRDDRDQRWNRRYHRTYSYNDDIYYRECRNSPDPAGVLVGALIGGLLGHTASGGRTGATIAGVVVGGAVGAALTSNLDCEDRSYAYKTYYTGFNAGRSNRNYNWRNPSNNHRGTFRVGRYYNDTDGFRCATYSQTVYTDGRRHRASGHACRQPDGTWAIVN